MYLRSQRQLDISMMIYSYDMFVLYFTCQYLCIISVMTDISLFILFLFLFHVCNKALFKG